MYETKFSRAPLQVAPAKRQATRSSAQTDDSARCHESSWEPAPESCAVPTRALYWPPAFAYPPDRKATESPLPAPGRSSHRKTSSTLASRPTHAALHQECTSPSATSHRSARAKESREVPESLQPEHSHQPPAIRGREVD